MTSEIVADSNRINSGEYSDEGWRDHAPTEALRCGRVGRAEYRQSRQSRGSLPKREARNPRCGFGVGRIDEIVELAAVAHRLE